MTFDWYEEIHDSSNITQGDILANCPIPLLSQSVYDSMTEEGAEIEIDIDFNVQTVVILSQACDIANDKIDSLIVCPVWSLQKLIDSNQYYKSSNAKESLRQGKEPSYHLLNAHDGHCDFSVVDFHRIYSLPKSHLQKHALTLASRLRILPPYREHLSQAFARYFMRVGLPVDIDRDSVKNYGKAKKNSD